MKAKLYEEEAQAVEPINEQELAIADTKPAKAEPPRQGLYLIDYKTLVKPTLIALAIFVVWAIAEFVLV